MKNLRISKKFLAIVMACLSLSVFSCKDELSNLDSNIKPAPSSMKTDSDIDKLYDEKSTVEREFGKSLAKSLSESRMLRDIIKNKALEMFNDDYEILYEMLKDEKVENNLTVEELITKNLTDKKSLKKLDSDYPTLTILVPSLPEEVFSASKWNVDSEIPKVAVRLTTSNSVPIINSDGSEYLLEGKYTPAFPVLVIKENERVISDKHKDFKNFKTRSLESKKGAKYRFLDDEFDRKIKKSRRFAFTSQLDPKLITAFNTYQNADGWQRDFIYYDITPGQTKGPFRFNFKDGIKSFRMIGDPMVAYNKLADQTDDPRINTPVINNASQWTGGAFEFKVICLVNGKNGVGAEIIKFFGATPQELFELTYTRRAIPTNFFDLTGIALKQKDLETPVLNWDLDQYSASIKVSIEEVDLSTTTTISESFTSEFASNFGIDNGTLKKIGLKFGASLKTTQTQSYTRVFKQDNDPLGDVTVNFADNIIISRGTGIIPRYTTREYNSGFYSISFEPIKVQ
jgi:hypothetical protein